jgi:hypothetical protein
MTPELIEATRVHMERELSYGEPGRVGADETLAIIAYCQRLMGDVLDLGAKLQIVASERDKAVATVKHTAAAMLKAATAMQEAARLAAAAGAVDVVAVLSDVLTDGA